MASTTPQVCDFCGKEADPEGEDCWAVVCVASHPEDLYHERCMQKYMRSMPGKNCDMSRRSGMPCLRGVGRGTQYKTMCPGKVTHCQKVVVKSKSKAAPAPAAPPQAPAPKAPKPAPKPKAAPKVLKPAATSSSSNKPHKAPENTWVPPKPIHLDPQAPRADPLGRNTPAPTPASKAAKKNAKRVAAKKRMADTASGPTDGSLSDTSSMAEVGSWAGAAAAGAGAAAGLSGHFGAEHQEADLWDDDDDEGVELDEEQLLLLELLRKQRGKQPHELLFHTPDHTSMAGDGSSSDGSDGDEDEEEGDVQQQQQLEASAGLHHAHVSGLQQQLAATSLSAGPSSAPHASQPHTHHQQQQQQPLFPQHSPLAAAVGPVASAPVAVTPPQGLAGYFQQPVVATPPAPLQQWHNGIGGVSPAAAAAVSPAAAASAAVEVVESDDEDDHTTEELMALLMGS